MHTPCTSLSAPPPESDFDAEDQASRSAPFPFRLSCQGLEGWSTSEWPYSNSFGYQDPLHQLNCKGRGCPEWVNMLTAKPDTGLEWIRAGLALCEESLIEALHFPGFWRNIGPWQCGRDIYRHEGYEVAPTFTTRALTTTYLDTTHTCQDGLAA